MDWKKVMQKCFKPDFTKSRLIFNSDTNQYNYIGARFPNKILMFELNNGFYTEYYRIPYKTGIEIRTQYVGDDDNFILSRYKVK